MLPYKQFFAIHLGFVTIYVWGLFLAIAFLAGIYLAAYFAEIKKINKEHTYNLAFLIILGAMIGGRLGYVLTNLSQFNSFLDLFRTWEGGMSFHGGFICGALFSYIYIKWKKLDLWHYFDLFAPSIALGYAITRIGCYLVADHIGKVTTAPWAIFYAGASRHPVALYHMFAGLAIFALLVHIEKKGSLSKIKYFRGMYFSLLLIIYGFIRFFIEFFREEPIFYGMHQAQYISIIMVILGSLMFYFLKPRSAAPKLKSRKTKKQSKS